jgi:1-deoxy-D-xylulose-5-phosphate synthase
MKPVLNIGLPDRFIEQGTQAELHHMLAIDGAGIEKQIVEYLAK